MADATDTLGQYGFPMPPSSVRTVDEKVRWYLSLPPDQRQAFQDFVAGKKGPASTERVKPDDFNINDGGPGYDNHVTTAGVLRQALQPILDGAKQYADNLKTEFNTVNVMADSPARDQAMADLVTKYGAENIDALIADVKAAGPTTSTDDQALQQLKDAAASIIGQKKTATDTDSNFIGGVDFLTAPVTGGTMIPGGTGKEVYDNLKTLSQTNPARLAQLQQLAMQAGRYPTGYVPTFGVFSEQDRTVFGSLINLAADTGQDMTTILQQQAQLGATNSVDQARLDFKAGPVTQINRKEPAELELIARKVATQLGGEVPKGFAEHFASWYNSEYVGRQEQSAKAVNAARWDAIQQKYAIGKYAPAVGTGADGALAATAAGTDAFNAHQQLSGLMSSLGSPQLTGAPLLPQSAPALPALPVWKDGQWVMPDPNATGLAARPASLGGMPGGPAQSALDAGAQPAATTVTSTDMMDPQTAAEVQMRAQHPIATGATDIVNNYMSVLNHLVGGQ